MRLLELLRGIHEAVLRTPRDGSIYHPHFLLLLLDWVIVSKLQPVSRRQNGKGVILLPMWKFEVERTHKYHAVLESLAGVDSLDHQHVVIYLDDLFLFVAAVGQGEQLVGYYGKWAFAIDFAIEAIKNILEQLVEFLNFHLVQIEIAPLHLLEHTKYSPAALQVPRCLDLPHKDHDLLPVLEEKVPVPHTLSLVVHVTRCVVGIFNGNWSNLTRFYQLLPELVLSSHPIDGLRDIPDLVLHVGTLLIELPLPLLEVAQDLQQVADAGAPEDLTVFLVYVSDGQLTLLYLAYQQLGKAEVPHVADEDGDLTKGDLLLEVEVADLIYRPARLGLLPLKGSHLHLLAVLPPRLQLVVFVEPIAEHQIVKVRADELLGELEERLPEPVGVAEVFDVLLEVYPFLEEVIYSSQIDSTPGENVLVEISNHQKPAFLAALDESLDHPQLSRVAVLKLIHYHKLKLIQIIGYFFKWLIPSFDILRSLHDRVVKGYDILTIILFLYPLQILLEVLPDDAAPRVTHDVLEKLLPFHSSVAPRHSLLPYPLYLLLQIGLAALQPPLGQEPSGEA